MLKEFLAKHGAIKFIRLCWIDYSGVFHCRLMTKAKAAIMSQSDHPYRVPVNTMIIPLSTSPGCDASHPQVWELHPDWNTLRVCGFATAHASVMCSLKRSGTNPSFDLCPRRLLANIMQDFEHRNSVSVLIGFEIEFILLDQSLQVPVSMDKIEGYSMSLGIRGSNLKIVEEIFEALEISNVPVHHMHTEATHQLEFSLEPEQPMQAIDSLMLAQETIRHIAVRHNRKATMTPKPFLSRFPTNGLHMHISLSRPEIGESFLQGVLTKLRALCAIGLPSWDSYNRVDDDGTGLWVGWGTENRDLPFRAIGPAHWEMRPADTTANFYLLLAGVLAAGSDAVDKKSALSWKDCRIFPENLSAGERESHGITETLPRSLQEALNVAKADGDLTRWLGRELMELYFKVKDKEAEVFGKMTDEERRQKFLAYF